MKKSKPPFLLVSLLLVLVAVAAVMGSKMFNLATGNPAELAGEMQPKEDKGKPNMARPVTPEQLAGQTKNITRGVKPMVGRAPGEEMPSPELGTAVVERKRQEAPKPSDTLVRSLRG